MEDGGGRGHLPACASPPYQQHHGRLPHAPPPRGRGWHGIFPHQCDKEGPFCSARDERLIPNSLGILCPLNCAIIPPSSGIHSILSDVLRCVVRRRIFDTRSPPCRLLRIWFRCSRPSNANERPIHPRNREGNWDIMALITCALWK